MILAGHWRNEVANRKVIEVERSKTSHEVGTLREGGGYVVWVPVVARDDLPR